MQNKTQLWEHGIRHPPLDQPHQTKLFREQGKKQRLRSGKEMHLTFNSADYSRRATSISSALCPHLLVLSKRRNRKLVDVNSRRGENLAKEKEREKLRSFHVFSVDKDPRRNARVSRNSLGVPPFSLSCPKTRNETCGDPPD